MSSEPTPAVGSILWRDLTVPNATEIQNFYCSVVGWESTPHAIGEYHDFNIQLPGDGETVAGICHARGSNANIPAQWLIYILVADVEASVQKCVELGGKVLDGPRMMGSQNFCVIQDPAGAVAALMSEPGAS